MSDRRYLISVPDLPVAGQAEELLELVLAAASLDLPVQVVLSGRGAELLAGASARSWLQLVEHGLAELFVHEEEGQAGVLPDGVHRIESKALASARRRSRLIRA